MFLVFESPWFLYLSLFVGILGVAAPQLRRNIFCLWLIYTSVVGNLLSIISLALLYFLFLLPYSWLVRFALRNKDSLKKGNVYDSMFIENDRDYNQKFFEKPW
jgi:hypothetical protein